MICGSFLQARRRRRSLRGSYPRRLLRRLRAWAAWTSRVTQVTTKIRLPLPESDVPRIIMAFNGDLESCLALYWLVHGRGYGGLPPSLNPGPEMYPEPLGGPALDLGATAAPGVGRRGLFPQGLCLPGAPEGG